MAGKTVWSKRRGFIFLLLFTFIFEGCVRKTDFMAENCPGIAGGKNNEEVSEQTEEERRTLIPDFAGKEEGAYAGTFIAEDLDILVPLYLADINGDKKTLQTYTNAEESAVFFKYGVQYVAADHVEQAFARLGEAVPGKTKAEVEWPDGSKASYICTRSCLGLNNGYLYDDTGRRLSDVNAGGMTTYTCTDTWQMVTMVFWQPDESAA